jgi:hypothetical protein
MFQLPSYFWEWRRQISWLSTSAPCRHVPPIQSILSQDEWWNVKRSKEYPVRYFKLLFILEIITESDVAYTGTLSN